MDNNNNSNSAKSSVTPKSVGIVLLTIVVVIAAAIGIAAAMKAAFSKPAPAPEKKEPVLTMKVNEQTGEEEYYDADGKYVYTIKKEYADAENKKLAREVYKNVDGEATKIVVYQDDSKTIDFVDEYENGKVSVHHKYEGGKDTGEYSVSEYDESGRENVCTNYDANGKVVSKKEESHNKDGNPIEYKVTDAKGNVLDKTEYTYDKKGREIKAVFYHEGETTGHIEKEYNKDGKLVKLNEFGKDGKLLDYRTYTYDKDGNITEKMFDADGKEQKKQ